MAHEKLVVGKWIAERVKNPDHDRNPYNPITEGPIERFTPNKDLRITLSSGPRPITLPPALSKPGSIPLMPAPALSRQSAPPFMPAPPLTSGHTPPFMPAPALTVGQAPPFMPPPALTTNQVPPFMEAPPITPSIPASRQPSLSTSPLGGHLELTPPPPLTLPTSIGGVTPTPSLTKPAVAGDPVYIPEIGPLTLKNPHRVAQEMQQKTMQDPIPYANSGQINPDRGDLQTKMAMNDARIRQTLSTIDREGKYVFMATKAGNQALNPDLYAKHLSRLGNALGKTGLAIFAATQLGLFLLNRHGKIWNPLSAAMPPLVGNFVPTALDVLTGTPRIMTGYDDTNGGMAFYSKNHGEDSDDDIHLKIAKGNYNEVRVVHYPPFLQTIVNGGKGVPDGIFTAQFIAPSQRTAQVDSPISDSPNAPVFETALKLRNKHTVEKQYSKNAVASVDDLVDDIFEKGEQTYHISKDETSGLARYTYRSTKFKPTIPEPVKDLGKKFIKKHINVDLGTRKTGEYRPEKEDGKDLTSKPLAISSFYKGLVPAKIKGENDQGFVVTRSGQSPSSKVTDDNAYMPISFTDLRSIEGSYRTIFFRPFNVKVNESLSPSWDKGEYYGRVDSVASYKSTNRSFSLSFELHAFGPEDLEPIYQKLRWLMSMVYPTFDRFLIFKAGPVVRLRVGDLISAVSNSGDGLIGLPGIIEGLDIDYGDSLWEMKNGLRVPRSIKISLNFTVLHDRPIGIGAEGKFGGLGQYDDKGRYLPPMNNESNKTGAQSEQKLAELSDHESFRHIPLVRTNKYDKFVDIDKAPPNLERVVK